MCCWWPLITSKMYIWAAASLWEAQVEILAPIQAILRACPTPFPNLLSSPFSRAPVVGAHWLFLVSPSLALSFRHNLSLGIYLIFSSDLGWVTYPHWAQCPHILNWDDTSTSSSVDMITRDNLCKVHLAECLAYQLDSISDSTVVLLCLCFESQ